MLWTFNLFYQSNKQHKTISNNAYHTHPENLKAVRHYVENTNNSLAIKRIDDLTRMLQENHLIQWCMHIMNSLNTCKNKNWKHPNAIFSNVRYICLRKECDVVNSIHNRTLRHLEIKFEAKSEKWSTCWIRVVWFVI